MKPIYYQHVATIECPTCKKDSGTSIESLMKKGAHTYGPWYCKSCGGGIKIIISATDDVEIETAPTHQEILTWDLLVLMPQKHPVFFNVGGKVWLRKPTDTVEEGMESKRYWYDEHTCPTNWTDHIETIAIEGDVDPHGLFQYVRSVTQVPGQFEDEEDKSNRQQLLEIFPEVFDKDFDPDKQTIDAELRTVADVKTITTNL